MNENISPLWTVKEVAEYLQIGAEAVRSMTRRGVLPGYKVGRVWRYAPEEVFACLQKQRKGQSSPPDAQA